MRLLLVGQHFESQVGKSWDLYNPACGSSTDLSHVMNCREDASSTTLAAVVRCFGYLPLSQVQHERHSFSDESLVLLEAGASVDELNNALVEVDLAIV